jgi:hypothetical protein
MDPLAGKTLGHGRPPRMPFLPLPVGHTLSNEAVPLRVPAMGDVDFSRDRAGGLELGFASCAADTGPNPRLHPPPTALYSSTCAQRRHSSTARARDPQHSTSRGIS